MQKNKALLSVSNIWHSIYGLSSQGYGFSSVMYGCESWTVKKAEHRRIDAFELWSWRRFLRVPWTARRGQPVHPKGDQSWVFIGRTDVDTETPVLWPPDAKSWLIGKEPDAGKDWGQEEKGMTEDEMVGWHHRLNGDGFGWSPGGDRQGCLVCCGSWCRNKSGMSERLNWQHKQCSKCIYTSSPIDLLRNSPPSKH